MANAEEHTEGSDRLARNKRIVVVSDLAGFTKACQAADDLRVARFLDDYYGLCEEQLSSAGGDVVKFLGDGFLATFDEEAGERAVRAVLGLSVRLDEAAARHGFERFRMQLGANFHLASVVEGEFGTGRSRQRDVIGRGVNQTFLLGRGPGFRISEPVYRSLRSELRSAWQKHKPPAVYLLDVAAEPFSGFVS